MFGGFGDYFSLNRGHRSSNRNNRNDFIDIDSDDDTNEPYYERNPDVMRYKLQQHIPKNTTYGLLNNYMEYMKEASAKDQIKQEVITEQLQSLRTILDEGSLEQLEQIRDNYLYMVSGIMAKISIIEKSRKALNNLNKEALFEMFKRLPQKDLVSCSRVCKKWLSTCDKYFTYLYKPTKQFAAVYNMLFAQYPVTSQMKCAMICSNPSKLFCTMLGIIPIYEVFSNIVRLIETAHEEKSFSTSTNKSKQKFSTRQFKGVTQGSFVGEQQYEIVYKLDTGVIPVCNVKLYAFLVIDDLHMKSLGIENMELYVKSVYDEPISHIVLSQWDDSAIAVIDMRMINTYDQEARCV